MILNKDLKVDVIYKCRLSGDRVLVNEVKETSYQIPNEEVITTYVVAAQRYNRITGEIESFFLPADNQLEELND